ncbi:chondroitinase-B domain-containing protein [Flaviaesturariibacter flavus]|nr:chondroitinase-B domain-containing protein [Flaviaesturariibacter flavus]
MKSMLLYYCVMLLACGKGEPMTPPVTPAPVTPPPVVIRPLRTVNVRTSNELKDALLNAQPGDDIVLADGVYSGGFVVAADRAGTAANPVTLRGSRAAILDGGSTSTGYVLHLQADYWTVRGITLRNGLKGIMADGIHDSEIDSVRVDGIGEEGIHLRRHSSRNLIRRCTIVNTGIETPDYGEGVYIGSAKSNWPTYTNGDPDRSDSNQVLDNIIGPGVAAECVDIKEGTTGGLVRGNRFNSDGISGANAADSWIDVKGNYWRIENNVGFNPTGSALLDGYQVHVAVAGWGNYNEFKTNDCTVNAAGYGVMVKLTGSVGNAVGNKVWADNQVRGAAQGVSNIPLTQ